MPVIEVTSSNFKDFIHKRGLVLLEFYSPWCAPCKMLGESLDELSNKVGQVIGKLNVDFEEAIKLAFKIESVPAILAFKDGRIVGKARGYLTALELLDFVNGLK